MLFTSAFNMVDQPGRSSQCSCGYLRAIHQILIPFSKSSQFTYSLYVIKVESTKCCRGSTGEALCSLSMGGRFRGWCLGHTSDGQSERG